jgi:maltose/moltooligosaccharide transporter
MGIFNMMIVIPMLFFAIVMSRLDLGFISIGFGAYKNLLSDDPRKMVALCGVCLVLASVSVLWVREGRAAARAPEVAPA